MPKGCQVLLSKVVKGKFDLCDKPIHYAGRCIDHYLEWKKIKRTRQLVHAKNLARQEKNHARAQLLKPTGRQLKKLRRFQKEREKELFEKLKEQD